MRWHLHVTVKPHWSWTLSDVASALRRDIERHGMHPVGGIGEHAVAHGVELVEVGREK